MPDDLEEIYKLVDILYVQASEDCTQIKKCKVLLTMASDLDPASCYLVTQFKGMSQKKNV